MGISKARDFLADWIKRFIENKDLILRKIDKITVDGSLMIARLKDSKEHAYLIEPFIEDMDKTLAAIKGYEPCSLVVYNTKENLDAVVKEWKKLVEFKRHFSIYFVNPFSRSEKRWTVFPATHHMIAGSSNVKPGLKTLFDTVEATTKEDVNKILES